MNDLLSLRDRVAVVAGGSGGIGASVVRTLSAAGASVLSVDRSKGDAPDNVRTLELDLARSESADEVAETVRTEYGRLHMLVHCAGITRDGVLWKLSDDSWREVLAVNLDSAFWLLRGLAPLMRESGGGSIVLVSSINGERGKFGQANYAASKAGLIGLGRTAARELGRFGIRVNLIAPGLIRTPMTADLAPEVTRGAMEESALHRVGEPEDVASVALFLCSDLSRHVTGQVLRVDGGQLMA